MNVDRLLPGSVSHSMNTTQISFLERLRRPNEPQAWARFADLYTPLLYYWLRRLGLQENDVADLIQEVFLVLLAKLPRFEYRHDGTFRGWLRTLTINKYHECQRRKKLPILETLANVPAEKAQAWGKHGHGYLRGPVPRDVQRAYGGGQGAARAQQGCGQRDGKPSRCVAGQAGVL